MALFLGIDFGTSYFKVGLFDEAGNLKGLSRLAVPKETPAAGHCEVAVPRFWSLLREGVSAALQQAGAAPSHVSGLSYSSQANTFLLLDEADRPLTPLVLWTDQRGDPLPVALADFTREPNYAQKVGFTGMSGQAAPAKLHWFKRQQPLIWRRVHRAQTLSDYFTYAVTGERAGDAGTAAFTGLYDLTLRQWWPAALAAFEIDPAWLSRPLRPGAPCGRTGTAAGELLGLPPGIPFAVGSIDHHVAALGSGLGRLADVSISTGTVLAAITRTVAVSPQSDCYHGPDFETDGYFRLIFDPNGAGQLEEYQRRLAPGRSIEELIALAHLAPEGRPPGNGKIEITADEQGRHMRYLLEKIAATQRTLVQRLTEGRPVNRIVATGGGARSEFWLQMKADMLGVPVVAPASAERACLGAAMIAAVAAGHYRDVREASLAMVQAGKSYLPDQQGRARYASWADQAG